VLLLNLNILGRAHQELDRLDPDVARPDIVGHEVEGLGSNPLVEDDGEATVGRSFRELEFLRAFAVLELLDAFLEGVEGVGGVTTAHLRDVRDVDRVKVALLESLGSFQLACENKSWR